MKKILTTLVFAAITGLAIGQAQNPVSWTYEARKKTADTYEIILTAEVEHPWHIYSQNTGKGGPIPTRVTFKANPLVSLAGNTKESGKLEKTFDENFKTNVLYFSDKVQFVQTVKVKGGIKTNLNGAVEYMVCDDSKCLPPVKKTFELKLQ
ncbi:MAG: cytochrome c-type biosis protein DsbD, protein-disulfide reductase [Sediminibacterium sp.]|jgi:thiol:disulfide interchange protein DsbD|nr:cytochrome c-type biosis protein DsbD, protein-disulfide reductase [Sediminibacterium sp.]